jgi:thiol-disulfide isomerase/thioredoxin
MLFRPALFRRATCVAPLVLSCAAFVVGLTPTAGRAQVAAEAEPAAGGALTVPPVPDGTPEELMAFVKGLLPPKARPRSREEMMGYMQGVAAASVQVADKILAQVKPDDAFATEAAKLKLESLTMLGRLGDEQAMKDMAAYATTLAGGTNPELAREAKRMLFVSKAQTMFSSGKLDAAPELIDEVAGMLAANPDDPQTAGLAMQFAGFFENVPDGEPLAVKAFEAIGPLFAKSSNPQIQKLGDGFAGTLRRLSLPGKPMEIKGTLLDGTPFDQKSLAGKVVLVDFWATWCGPCRAEIPNMKKEYEKYHPKGFEVVGISLDEDRAALEKFVKSEEIPWPILFDQSDAGGNALADFYGIRGIPQLILIGRDGNVITLNARGPKLAEALEKLFKDGG